MKNYISIKVYEVFNRKESYDCWGKPEIYHESTDILYESYEDAEEHCPRDGFIVEKILKKEIKEYKYE